jgi:hypothetical protein
VQKKLYKIMNKKVNTLMLKQKDLSFLFIFFFLKVILLIEFLYI